MKSKIRYIVCLGVVLYDYVARAENELTIRAGQAAYVTWEDGMEAELSWCQVVTSSGSGFVPFLYVDTTSDTSNTSGTTSNTSGATSDTNGATSTPQRTIGELMSKSLFENLRASYQSAGN